ncbi:MAG: DUF4382 domain-containing protein [Gammaproteobacteria bacterium]|nr:DUF4382 domain-containing protein [Gammaproteobacteria bacterium]
MKTTDLTLAGILVAPVLGLALTGCGGGGASTGSLSVAITDAAVDNADNVVVEFFGVELQPASGELITYDFTEQCSLDPASCQIDLLALNGGVSELILDNETVPSGEYSWLRFMVNASPNVRDSYIVVNGEEFELQIPSGAESGLKLNQGFVVPAGGSADFTVDFDLRKSVHDPVGSSDYLLRPALRIVDNSLVGTLTGNVDASFFAGGLCSGAVYVFFGGTVDAPDDEDGEGGGPDPITSVLVPDDGVYAYTVSFLSEGDYHIAFTCDAAADDPAVDDDAATVAFLAEATVTIIPNDTTDYPFPPAP